MTYTPPTLPSAIPDQDFILQYLGTRNPETAPGLRDSYALVAPIALDNISRAVSIPFPITPADTPLLERMVWSGRTDFLLPRYWPVVDILEVQAGGVYRLKNGTELELAKGAVFVAPGDEGRIIRVALGVLCERQAVFVTYRAGMDTLPPALLDVFVELCLLIDAEKGRVGTKSEKVKELQTSYIRNLPQWALRALNGFRRQGYLY